MIDILGFSATRNGLTGEQCQTLREVVVDFAPKEIHHGDCRGGDFEFHMLCIWLRIQRLHLHPPTDPKLRAHSERFRDIRLPDEPGEVIIWPEAEYLTRNVQIVGASQWTICCPSEMVEVKRGSGTWHVIRYLRDNKLPRTLIWPDGTTTFSEKG